MVETIDEPPVQSHVNIQNCGFMPLLARRLLGSEFYAISTGDEFKAGITLWCNAWYQVPAGSLPNEDRVLANLAGYGRDVDEWLKVKPMALRGFKRCEQDGRLYHPLIAEKANEAYASGLLARETGRAGGQKSGASRRAKRDQPPEVQGQLDLGETLKGPSPENEGAFEGAFVQDGRGLEAALEPTTLTRPTTQTTPTTGLPAPTGAGRGCRIPSDWVPNRAELRYGLEKGLTEAETRKTAENFRDYWLGRTGQIAVKADWPRTWQMWVRTEADKLGRKPPVLAESQPAYVIPRNGEIITDAMCPGEHQKKHVGRIYLHRESDEWNAWTFHYGVVARKKGQWPPPTVPTHFSDGWSFPACWPPGHPNATPATE